MLVSRLLVTIVLLPVGLGLIAIGGIPYTLFIVLVVALAGWEFLQLFRVGGYRPALVLVVGGAALLVLDRYLAGFDHTPWLLSTLILLSMVYHLVAFERGRDQAATDFGITLAGILYLGWIGAYFISLRELPEGEWWVLQVLPTVWLADTGAYFVGRKYGRHKLSPRLSPKKSWEGYLAGVVTAIVGGYLLAEVWAIGAGPGTALTPVRGAFLGLVLAVLTPLGDLGESMVKRQVGVKDSGDLLRGHGGVFDRIDSWLWGVVIGYYLVTILFG
jgi:phosphatidate cytidylyltransferase